MNPVVNLTAKAVQEINEILSRGKGVEIAVRNGKVVVWETASKKKYEAVGLSVRAETLLPVALFLLVLRPQGFEWSGKTLIARGENPTKNGK